MHLKIPRVRIGFKLSNLKQGCREAALHLFVKRIQSNLDIRTPPYTCTFDLRTNFSECITLYTYLKFDIRTSITILEFNICTIQSTHNEYRTTYI